ncbi:hypothetical protein BX600DRAFT_508857 [Xylariales sp. PMI_506]|nr:hypothetical protein BX600DRAFT_508857 [Xylariales sp. PMI_506]
MSADLFAEFESFSKPQPSPQRSAPSESQKSSAATDPFAFLSSPPVGHSSQFPAVTQSWPALGHVAPASGAASSGGFGDIAFGTVHQRQMPLEDFNDEDDDGGDDDEGWGDFETAESEARDSVLSELPSTVAHQLPHSSAAPVQRTRVTRASTIELMTNTLIDLPGVNALPDEVRSPPWLRQSFDKRSLASPSPTAVSNTTAKFDQPQDPNILFDADNFDQDNPLGGDGETGNDEDDFGEFETVAAPVQPSEDLISDLDLFTPPATSKKSAAHMLSALNLNAPVSPYPQAPKSPSFQERNPFPGLSLDAATKPAVTSSDVVEPETSPVTAWPSMEQQSAGSNKLDADWVPFEDHPSKVTEPTKQPRKNDDWDWNSFDAKESKPKKPQPTAVASENDNSSWAWDSTETSNDDISQLNDGAAPPINVPPPSILLSVFPQVLTEANESLFKPVGGQVPSIKSRILSDPKVLEFLRAYLLLATVAARIIAGRKLRWHRDKFLSQGMSISAAGSKGMKLAGVDKTQAAREDREAGDILDLWKEQVGRLRTAVVAANSSTKLPSQHLKIPELRDNMTVQTASKVPTAPKPCVICGLKREERVARVDFEVEDSFGEWWAEHWGHTACKRFWLKHEGLLRQR